MSEPSRMTFPRTPGSTRDKRYWTQVWETVWVSFAFVALGLLIRWITTMK